ncbi:MAG: HD domain-containing protein [Caldilineaceae bacterium]
MESSLSVSTRDLNSFIGITSRIDWLTKESSKLESNFYIIKDAYELARTAHKNRFRQTGRSYFVHPTELALLIYSKGFGIEVVTASLLHDTIEDTAVTFEEIKSLFGSRIANLVLTVHRLRHITQNPRWVNKCNDQLAIVVKLCDRLVNLRDLYGLSFERRIRIAKETLLFFVPIAQQLGLPEIAPK